MPRSFLVKRTSIKSSSHHSSSGTATGSSATANVSQRHQDGGATTGNKWANSAAAAAAALMGPLVGQFQPGKYASTSSFVTTATAARQHNGGNQSAPDEYNRFIGHQSSAKNLANICSAPFYRQSAKNLAIVGNMATNQRTGAGASTSSNKSHINGSSKPGTSNISFGQAGQASKATSGVNHFGQGANKQSNNASGIQSHQEASGNKSTNSKGPAYKGGIAKQQGKNLTAVGKTTKATANKQSTSNKLTLPSVRRNAQADIFSSPGGKRPAPRIQLATKRVASSSPTKRTPKANAKKAKLSTPTENVATTSSTTTPTINYTYETFFNSDGRSKRAKQYQQQLKSGKVGDVSESKAPAKTTPTKGPVVTAQIVPAPVIASVLGESNKTRYTCTECGKNYATSSNLSRHKQTHRSLDSQLAKKCPHCGKVYVSMPALAMHILTHNLNHQCPECGKAFSRPWLLNGHMRSHTGEKPFGCQHCGKQFADRSNLRAHMQTHSSLKVWKCRRCNKQFALKSYLNKHYESSCYKDGGAPDLDDDDDFFEGDQQQVPHGILIVDGRSSSGRARLSNIQSSTPGTTGRTIRFKSIEDSHDEDSSDESDPELKRIKRRVSPKSNKKQATTQPPPLRAGMLRNREKLRPPKYHQMDGGDYDDGEDQEQEYQGKEAIEA